MSSKKVCKGYRWSLNPGLRHEDLDVLWKAFPRVEDLAGARVLKANRLRTVAHLPLAALRAGGAGATDTPEGLPVGGLIVKVYRYRSLWDRLRYFLIRHRALQERHALERLKAMGLPVPECLGAATLRQAGAVSGGGLLLEFLTGSVPLSARLAGLEEAAAGEADSGGGECPHRGGEPRRDPDPHGTAGAPSARQGGWHRDFHGGNILCMPGDDSLRLIDVHSCIFLPKMPRRLRRQGVAKLVHSLADLLPPDGRRVLLSSYGVEALAAGGMVRVEESVLRAVARIETTRLRSRSKRCFIASTRFAVERERGAATFHLRSWPHQKLEQLWGAAPCGESPGGEAPTDEGSGRPRRVTLDERGFLVSHRRYSLLESLRSLILSHPLRRFYACGHALAVREIPTPAVVALRETRRFGLVRGAHLVVALEGEFVTLESGLTERFTTSPKDRDAGAGRQHTLRRHSLARAVGGLLRRLHDARLEFSPLSAKSILVRTDPCPERGGDSTGVSTPELLIIEPDFRVLPRPISHKQRLSGLLEFVESLEGRVGRTDLLRGLRSYAVDGEDWRRLVRESRA